MEDTLLKGKSNNIEYKVEIPNDKKKFLKTVVAFTNGNGGQLVFGVDDKTNKVIGIDRENLFKDMDAITDSIFEACEPKILPDLSLRTIDDKTVIVVNILSGSYKPYFLKPEGVVEGTYIRVSATPRRAEWHILQELILEGQNQFYDQQIVNDLEISDEDINNFCDSLKRGALKNILNEEEKKNVKDVDKNVLISWGILKEKDHKIYPTNAYALLTGQATHQPIIQCGVFKGTTRAYFVDRREFSGTLQELVEKAYQYVLEKINMGMRIEGIYRQDVYELPIASIRELIANALVHRSYLDSGNIQVCLFDDRLEVTSPGSLLNSVSLEKVKEGYSKLRNPAIATAFSYMHIIEKWGTGIPRMMKACKEMGLLQPQIINEAGDFRVNMYRAKTTQTTQTFQTELQNIEDSLIRMIEKYPRYS